MELHQYLGIAISLLALIGGFVSYVLGLRVKHDILQNNEHLEKEMSLLKDKQSAALTALRDELTREFWANLNKHSERLERIEREFGEFTTNFPDRILNVVNGKYVRTDLQQQTMIGVQERFVSLKELIEVNMDKIEQAMDRQILDLKDRIVNTR